MSYEGYKNYGTWNVVWWVIKYKELYYLNASKDSESKELYNLIESCANYDEFVGTMRELSSLETPDHVAWNDSSLDIDDINHQCFPEDSEDDEVEDDNASWNEFLCRKNGLIDDDQE